MFLNINSQKVYFQKTGRGKNLIMLHGWGQDVSTFWPIVDQLKEDFTLWLIDLPGFGRSELPKKPMFVATYAEIIEEFINKKRIKKPIILGHSLGGRIAIKLASYNSPFLSKLILVSSAGIKPRQDSFKFIIYLLAKVIKHFIPNIFNLKERLRYFLYKSLEADYLDANQMQPTLVNILEDDLTDDLPKIKNKTLLIWGEGDLAVPLKYGRKMYQLIPNARLEVLENVGHFPHQENSKLFTYYIKDFCL